jgi:carbamoyltransferase
MKNLLLTLGHNSSAILIEDGEIKWGYETERITGLKSDSRFPEAVMQMTGVQPDAAYITHWSTDGDINSLSQKHYRPDLLENVRIITHNPDFTHHDSHMAAAVTYAGTGFHRGDKTYCLVIDGFGSYGEHLTLYKMDRDATTIVRRVHGYGTSLGLWYQYATAFMGMKMHEDEYKLLGYEVHVNPIDAEQLDADAKLRALQWVDDMDKSVYTSPLDPVYNINALPAIKDKIFKELNAVCMSYNISDPTNMAGRAILSYYVQAVLEQVVKQFMQPYPWEHLLCSGGVFYNVKLNKTLLDQTPGQICIYPLAGDQGNAIGLYAAWNPKFMFPRNLNWGVRQLKDMGQVKNLHVVDWTQGLRMVQEILDHVGYVNLVRGSMEFGPRAMCNTSTLAKPTMDNVRAINAMNKRNTVMPMAPVMDMATYKHMFERTNHVWKSHAHMIIAMEYMEYLEESYKGVTHEYQRPHHHHTGRPQVIPHDDLFMTHVLHAHGGMLINTSFNFHGQPIAFDMESIIRNHMMQLALNPLIQTVVIKNA